MTASEHTDHTGYPPQASAWGVASRRVVNEFGRGPGSPSERGCPGRPPQRPKLPRVWGGTPQGPIRPPLEGGAVGPHIRVSNARLNPPDAEGGESGSRAQYLLDILGTTDRLPPLCPSDAMTILTRCYEHDPYSVAVYIADIVRDVTFDAWFAFRVRYDLETENVHRSYNDPDIIYTLYSVPFSRSLEVLRALEECYRGGVL